MEESNGNWAASLNLEPIWSPPPLGWLKINFDGSIHPNNIARLGCSIRYQDGGLIIAKGIRTHNRSINMTEVRSALLGITLAKDFANSALGLILEGDSAFAYATLNCILGGLQDGNVEEMLARTMMDCQRIMISLVDRRAYSAANYVANVSCISTFLWERGMPLTQALSFILSKDNMAM
ncbi:hypothetical protein KSP39_PZI017972 [Platanthera zijinensis]|uniref:RNase H type-1 domain-containing protein n=1 Tax=Platanthera zijinensis TaxID=2320716 RepID=A0AAP0B4R1_9ASPA